MKGWYKNGQLFKDIGTDKMERTAKTPQGKEKRITLNIKYAVISRNTNGNLSKGGSERKKYRESEATREAVMKNKTFKYNSFKQH